MEENMMLIVSDETHGRTTADSVRPSNENKHKRIRSAQMGGEVLIERVSARVMNIAYL
jgi:hypothetical protein